MYSVSEVNSIVYFIFLFCPDKISSEYQREVGQGARALQAILQNLPEMLRREKETGDFGNIGIV